MANYDELTARLYESGHKYRKELLAMPLAQLNTLLPHMTLRLGVRGKESVGELDTDAELRPFTGEKNATDATDIQLRTLETFHGSVVKEFIPSHLVVDRLRQCRVDDPDRDGYRPGRSRC